MPRRLVDDRCALRPLEGNTNCAPPKFRGYRHHHHHRLRHHHHRLRHHYHRLRHHHYRLRHHYQHHHHPHHLRHYRAFAIITIPSSPFHHHHHLLHPPSNLIFLFHFIHFLPSPFTPLLLDLFHNTFLTPPSF